MQYHTLYGPSIPEMGWVPSPSYLLRRDRILRLLDAIAPCDTLEVGCGAGALLHELAERGFTCTALEFSAVALNIARQMNANSNSNVKISDTADYAWNGRFDCVMAFEVLEHIENDRDALMQWRKWLKPGGILLLSVPAHMRQWTASDEWAGHYRRYERKTLEALLGEECGFVIEHFESYGSPLANLIDPVRSRVHAGQLRRRTREGCDDRDTNNSRSGVERSVETRLYPYLCSFPGRALMHAAFLAQGTLGRMGIGKGYLLRARKTEARQGPA
jgi:SAM-dependent methyltransferase